MVMDHQHPRVPGMHCEQEKAVGEGGGGGGGDERERRLFDSEADRKTVDLSLTAEE